MLYLNQDFELAYALFVVEIKVAPHSHYYNLHSETKEATEKESRRDQNKTKNDVRLG